MGKDGPYRSSSYPLRNKKGEPETEKENSDSTDDYISKPAHLRLSDGGDTSPSSFEDISDSSSPTKDNMVDEEQLNKLSNLASKMQQMSNEEDLNLKRKREPTEEKEKSLQKKKRKARQCQAPLESGPGKRRKPTEKRKNSRSSTPDKDVEEDCILTDEAASSKEDKPNSYFIWLEHKEDALMRLYSAPGVLTTIRSAKTTKAAVYKKFARMLTEELDEQVLPRKISDKISTWARKYEQVRVVLRATGKGDDEKQRAKKAFRLFDKLELLYGDSLADNPPFLLQSPTGGGKHINVGGKSVRSAESSGSTKKGQAKRLDDTFDMMAEQGKAVTQLMVNSNRNAERMIGAISSIAELMRGGSYSGVLEQSHRLLDTGFEVTESAVYSEGSTVPVQCTNYLERPFILYKNQVVACILPLDCGWQSNSSVSGVREVRPEEDGGHHDTTDHRTDHVTDYGQERTDDQEGPWTKDRLFDELRIDSIDVTTEEREQLRDIVWRNKEVFSRNKHDIGKCNLYEATIQLKENHNAKWVPWRPTPYRQREALNGHLEELLKAGVVEDCTSRSNWQSPVFLVEKPGKVNDYRWVLDARNINLQSIPDGYELPNINHVVDKIGGCKFFSTFDLSQSFHQISLDEQSRPITAFNVNGRRLQYKTMIMGHCSSAQQFSRCMSKILDRMTVEQLVAFLDDLLLGSKDISTHLERLERVLAGFANANMKLSPGKCHFLRTEVNYVGLKISEEGLSITEDRVKVVKELRAPDSVKSLQSLIGFLNYNRKFIKNFATKAAPLYEVLKQSNNTNRQQYNRRGRRPRFNWTEEAGYSLEILKKDIANAITLCIPDVDDPLDSYEVTLDGSNKGSGAELTQIVGGRRRTIGYFSKKVEKHKRERSQTKLEFLAMVEALTHWRVYLLGTRTFRIITDCESLLTYETTLFSKPDAFMTRQLSKISGFNASISHISGKENNTADFLSRYPYRNTEKDCGTQTDLDDVRVGLITGYNFGYGSCERNTDWDNIPFRRLGGKGGTERNTSTQTEIEDDRVNLVSTEDTPRVRGHDHGAPQKIPSWILAARAAEDARERTRGTAHTTEESNEDDVEGVCEELRRLERRRYHLDQALRAPKVKYAVRKRLQEQIRGLESELEEKTREYETQETEGRAAAISSIRINDQTETEQRERGDNHKEMGTTDPTTTQYRLDLEDLLKDKTLLTNF